MLVGSAFISFLAAGGALGALGRLKRTDLLGTPDASDWLAAGVLFFALLAADTAQLWLGPAPAARFLTFSGWAAVAAGALFFAWRGRRRAVLVFVIAVVLRFFFYHFALGVYDNVTG